MSSSDSVDSSASDPDPNSPNGSALELLELAGSNMRWSIADEKDTGGRRGTLEVDARFELAAVDSSSSSHSSSVRANASIDALVGMVGDEEGAPPFEPVVFEAKFANDAGPPANACANARLEGWGNCGARNPAPTEEDITDGEGEG